MNHKTLSERMNNIMNRGSEKWLSRSLREEEDIAPSTLTGRKDVELHRQQRPGYKPDPNKDIGQDDDLKKRAAALQANRPQLRQNIDLDPKSELKQPSPLDTAREQDYNDERTDQLNSQIEMTRDEASTLMDKVGGLLDERDGVIEDRQKTSSGISWKSQR